MNDLLNKINARTEFSNGYTASVVYFPDLDEHQVAVLFNDKLVYDTPITNDVVRCKTAHDAWNVINQIMMLPERKEKSIIKVGDFVINEGVRYRVFEIIAENELSKYQIIWCVDDDGEEFEFRHNELEHCY